MIANALGSDRRLGHRRDDARDLLAARGPGHGIRGVGVHDAADVRHVPIDVRVRGGVARRGALAARCPGTTLPSRSQRIMFSGVRSSYDTPDGLITKRSSPGTRPETFPPVQTMSP